MANQTDVSRALQGTGINVSNLTVKTIGGLTAIYGAVASEEDRRKAEQAIEARLGKISNHLEVQVAHGGMGIRLYTVKAGDTLSRIAEQHYGDPSQWKRILEANADLIRDPDKIQPGWQLQLP